MVLLKEPWLVEEEVALAFGAAMYKWMQQRAKGSQIHYPSGHEIATGLWPGFDGVPTQSINTVIELSLNQRQDSTGNAMSCLTLGEDKGMALMEAYWFIRETLVYH